MITKEPTIFDWEQEERTEKIERSTLLTRVSSVGRATSTKVRGMFTAQHRAAGGTK